MGTAPGRRPLARSSGSCPGRAATGLAAVTLAICVSSAVPPLLAPIVTRAYGRRGCRYAKGVPVAALPQGVASASRTQGVPEKDDGPSRLLDYVLPCRLAVLPSCRLAVLPSPQLPPH